MHKNISVALSELYFIDKKLEAKVTRMTEAAERIFGDSEQAAPLVE